VDLFPIVLLVVFAVVLFVLPARQRKRMQAQAHALQESLNIGTPVTTTSGLHGTVAGLAERTVDLEIAPGVVVTFARPAIMEVRSPAVAPEGGTHGIDGTTGIDGTGFDGPANGTTGGRPADGPL
jgi:preprotein translocase subunit YajC